MDTLGFSIQVLTVLVSILVIGIMNVVDRKSKERVKGDNWIKLFVGFFGITGPLASIPALEPLRDFMITRYRRKP